MIEYIWIRPEYAWICLTLQVNKDLLRDGRIQNPVNDLR